MSIPMTSLQVLDREFLILRAKIIELAAGLDRLQRASGSVEDDPRIELIYEAIDCLRDSNGDRAEQIQLIFSRIYNDDWQKEFDIAPQG